MTGQDDDTMKSLPGRIMGYAETKPEATPIQAEDLLHLGGRAAVSGRSPASRVPSDSCGSTVAFTCAPSRPDLGFARRVWSKAITALASLWGETIV